jgi:hypothetical protein
MKRGDANIWWIIIGAVIALVVVVVVLVIFTGRTGKLEGGLSSCEGKGGACVSSTICPANSLYSSAFDCPDTKRCCVGSPKACPRGDECGTSQYCNEGYCYAS